MSNTGHLKHCDGEPDMIIVRRLVDQGIESIQGKVCMCEKREAELFLRAQGLDNSKTATIIGVHKKSVREWRSNGLL